MTSRQPADRPSQQQSHQQSHQQAPRGSEHRPEVVVVGAGPTGLTTALLLARAGVTVTVVDRDPDGPGAPARPITADGLWAGWDRRGVSQFHHAHVALPRWYRCMSEELPEVIDTLRAIGGTAVNWLHLNPAALTGGRRPGDERFDTVTARRPVLEGAISLVAETEPGVTLRRGCRATGLKVVGGTGRRRVVGVQLGNDLLPADLVVDAAGNRTPVPGWLTWQGIAVGEERETDGLVYYARHFRSPAGPPTGAGVGLSHHPSFSVLTLPADNGTWAVVLVVAAGDRATRGLRHGASWDRAVRAVGIDPRWWTGTPMGGVQVLRGLPDVIRRWAPGGDPVVAGLVPVGDALATTSPFLGRGLSHGALQAIALRDAVATALADGVGLAEVGSPYAGLVDQRVMPYLGATVGYARHRVAQLAAEARGDRYLTDDPAWAAGAALAIGSRFDPTLLRAHATIGALLATPAEVFADPDLRARLTPWFGMSPYPQGRAGREVLLEAIGNGTGEPVSTGRRQPPDRPWPSPSRPPAAPAPLSPASS